MIILLSSNFSVSVSFEIFYEEINEVRLHLFWHFFVFLRIVWHVFCYGLDQRCLKIERVLFRKLNFFKFELTFFWRNKFFINHIRVSTFFERYPDKIVLLGQKHSHKNIRIFKVILKCEIRIFMEVETLDKILMVIFPGNDLQEFVSELSYFFLSGLMSDGNRKAIYLIFIGGIHQGGCFDKLTKNYKLKNMYWLIIPKSITAFMICNFAFFISIVLTINLHKKMNTQDRLGSFDCL